jgi:hypothetical protein
MKKKPVAGGTIDFFVGKILADFLFAHPMWGKCGSEIPPSHKTEGFAVSLGLPSGDG